MASQPDREACARPVVSRWNRLSSRWPRCGVKSGYERDASRHPADCSRIEGPRLFVRGHQRSTALLTRDLKRSETVTASKAAGKLYLIGAGPGDPELLTLKAARVLRECDVILYDRLVSAEILAFAGARAELIYVGKHEREQHCTQSRIFDLILSRALEGKTVARLKGGDPLVFGRGAEEWA